LDRKGGIKAPEGKGKLGTSLVERGEVHERSLETPLKRREKGEGIRRKEENLLEGTRWGKKGYPIGENL